MPEESVGLLNDINFNYKSSHQLNYGLPLSLKVDLIVLGNKLNFTLNQVQGNWQTTSKYSKIYIEDDVNSNITLENMTDLVNLVFNFFD